jgi:outer membrane protein TolC
MHLQFPQEPKPITLTVAEAIDLALANSPAYQHQIATVTESRHQEQKARKEKGVNVSLDVNVGMQQVDPVLGRAYRDQRLYALGAVTVSVPLMDHGAAKNRHAAAQAWVEREESALDEAERRLSEDVTTTLHNINVYRQLLEQTTQAVTMADEVFELNAENYANGLCDMNTYTLAQNRRDEAYNQYLSALEKYWTTYYHLQTLIGD